MAFSIVIPSKTASNLFACVKALREAGETARVIVVDDGLKPPAGTDDLMDAWADEKNVHFIWGVKPFIFARNCNVAMRAAGRDDVILLNDDALLVDRFGFTGLSAVTKNTEYGIIGAVTDKTGQPLQFKRTGIDAGIRHVPHIAFVCVYIPRRTIDMIGGLDERYCLDYGVEDRDYCEAVNRAGLKVGVYDYCFVDHSSLVSSFRGAPDAPRSFAKNYELFKQKWGIKE